MSPVACGVVFVGGISSPKTKAMWGLVRLMAAYVSVVYKKKHAAVERGGICVVLAGCGMLGVLGEWCFVSFCFCTYHLTSNGVIKEKN